MIDRHITLAHGNGGRFMRELIESLFAPLLAHPGLETRLDAATLSLEQPGALVVTTDGFTVQPLEFPGGDAGSLAVHGTVNDLAVAGATPLHLTLSVILEEGLEVALLRRLIASMARAAREAGVGVVAGDTKVVPRGHGGGVYFVTTGLGVRPPGVRLDPSLIRPGDQVIVSGPVGDHGTAVMLAREQFGLRGEVRSDAAALWPMTGAVRALAGLRFMRDPTRGGLATVAHELTRLTGLGVRLREADIPVRDPVRAVCEMLGYDPYHLACEGRLVAVCAPETTEAMLAALRAHPQGEEAALIGAVTSGPPRAILETTLGGERLLRELEEEPLPRIC